MKDFQKSLKKLIKRNKIPVKQLHFLVFPILLLVILFSLKTINVALEQKTNKSVMKKYNAAWHISPLPLLKNEFTPFITASAAIVMDEETKAVLYAKNPSTRLSMASTTKIMTALTAMDYFKENDILTVMTERTEGTVVGITKGDLFYFDDLLYAMLLPSGNDAAYTIAQNYPGGVNAFVKKMNQKATDLHLSHTHYTDPAGLDDDGNYMSAYDLALLSSSAEKNKLFARITGTKHKLISNVDGTVEYELSNLNKLLGFSGVNGIKTGTTEGAGEVLATSKVENGHTFIIVVMRSQDRFSDTQNLLQLISNNIVYFTPVFHETKNIPKKTSFNPCIIYC